MNDPNSLADEFEIRRVIEVARDFIRDRRSASKIRAQLQGYIATIVAECEEADRGRPVTVGSLLAIASAVFSIGAIAGKPTMVTAYEAGKRSVGGVKSGERRREAAQKWQDHAAELMIQIRHDQPSISNEGVAVEVSGRWRLIDVECPGPRHLQNYLIQLVEQGKVQPKVKRSRSFQK